MAEPASEIPPDALDRLVRAYDRARDKRRFLQSVGPCGAILVIAGVALADALRAAIDEEGAGAVFGELHRQRAMELGDG